MRARRTDDKHATIALALRTLGYPCKSLHTQGGGVEDLLVGARKREERWTGAGERGGRYAVDVHFWVLVEVKTPRNQAGTVKPSQFTPAQREWHARTALWPRLVVTGAADAVRQLRLLCAPPGEAEPLEDD